MFAETVQQQELFRAHEIPTDPIKNKMWMVNDRNFRNEEARFQSGDSHLTNQICESGMDGMLGCSQVPKGLLLFMDAAAEKFGEEFLEFLVDRQKCLAETRTTCSIDFSDRSSQRIERIGEIRMLFAQKFIAR